MRRPAESGLLLFAALLAQTAAAQERGGVSSLQYSLGGSVLLSDNLSRDGLGKDRGALLAISPGISYASRSASTRLQLDYTLNAVQPVKTETPVARLQNSLRANLNTQDKSSGLALDAQAGIGQQSVSLLGSQQSLTQGPSVGSTNLNRAEVYTASLMPSWRTRLAGLASLTLSHRVSASNTKGSSNGDSTAQVSALALSDLLAGPLGWNAQLQRQRTDNRGGRDTLTDTAQLGLSWRPDTEWRLGLNAGRERSDLNSNQRRSGDIYGASVDWQPGPRTRVGLTVDDRLYGRTHGFLIDHRFPRATLSFRDSRTLTQPGVVGAAGVQTNFDLLFAQLASVEPDPDRRAALVRTTLSQLGLDADAIATQGFVAGRATLTRQRTLSAGYRLTPRSTLSLSASRADSERLGAASDANDDFSLFPSLRTQGLSLSAAHRLTPSSGLSAVLQWQRNEGAAGQQASSLRGALLSWTTRIGPRSQGSLTLRRSEYSSTRLSYTENALLASYNQQF